MRLYDAVHGCRIVSFCVMVLVVEPDVAAEYVLWELYGLQAVCYVPVLDVGIEVCGFEYHELQGAC